MLIYISVRLRCGLDLVGSRLFYNLILKLKKPKSGYPLLGFLCITFKTKLAGDHNAFNINEFAHTKAAVFSAVATAFNTTKR